MSGRHGRVLLVCHFDNRATGGDWARVKTIAAMLTREWEVEVIGFKGYGDVGSTGMNWIRSPLWALSIAAELIKGGYQWAYVYNTGPLVVFLGVLNKLHLIRARVAYDALVTFWLQAGPGSLERARTTIRHISELTAARMSDLLVLASETGEHLLAGVAERSVVIPGSVDTTRFRKSESARKKVRNSLGLAEEPLLGLIGPFDRVYNRASLTWLRENLPTLAANICIVLVGRFETRDKIEADRVIQVGYVANYPEYLSALDALVIVRDKVTDGAVNRMIEAMSTELVVFCNELVCVTEGKNLISGENVFISPASDLATLVNRELPNRDKLSVVGENARRYVMSRNALAANGVRLNAEMTR